MAIEDEIINIADIDVGTEILKSDRLLIETNNGTKLIQFKDFVIGPDNISSVRQGQIESNVAGEAETLFSVVTGYSVLTTDTSPGVNTTYSDLSGSIELSKFNYNAIETFASVSADIAKNTALLDDLLVNITNLQAKLESTSSAVLNSITLTTSACNFSVKGGTGGGRKSKAALSFSTADLNPSTTNPNCGFQLAPFKITFPGDGDGFNSGTRYLVEGNFRQGKRASGVNSFKNGTVTLYIDKADGTSTPVFTSVAEPISRFMGVNTFQKILTINTGDILRISADTAVTGTLDGTKVS